MSLRLDRSNGKELEEMQDVGIRSVTLPARALMTYQWALLQSVTVTIT
jgi:hypothetical protein